MMKKSGRPTIPKMADPSDGIFVTVGSARIFFERLVYCEDQPLYF